MQPLANADTSTNDILLSDCVVGIGSFHGDDRAGWEVIDRLRRRPNGLSHVCLHKAAVPHNVIDWLHPQLYLHLVDACAADVSGVQRLEVLLPTAGQLVFSQTSGNGCATGKIAEGKPQDELSRKFAALRSRSTHHFDLLSTLELASVLGRLPIGLTLWTIAIDSAKHNAEIGEAARSRVIECATRIEQELQHA
ncbi:MAG: hypothetical protein ABI557_21495 [Aureliella sp.]